MALIKFNCVGIWNLKVPPKVKNLIWRTCRGCLPTRVRLLDKGVVCPTNCVSCDSDHEHLLHVFFDCPFAIQVWNRIGLWGSVQHALSHTASATDAIFSLLENLSVELSQRLSTVMWSLWKHRNIRVWDNVTETSAVVVDRARNMVTDWQLANTLDVRASTPHPQHASDVNTGASTSHQHDRVSWHPPCQVDTNAISTRLSLLTITVQALAFVFVTRKVFLSWPGLSHIRVLFRWMWEKL